MIAVVAYGNPLRGDDGAAWRVAQRLERAGDPVVVLTLHQLTPEVASLLSQADSVIFIDAARGAPPGRVSTAEIGPAAAHSPLTHHLSPETVLALTQRLYSTCPRAALVTIAGESFEFAEALSAPVRRALPEALRAVRQLIRAWSLSAASDGAALGRSRIPHA
jgi:hydrogenase maturation protease